MSSEIVSAPKGTFAFLDRLYTKSGGYTDCKGPPQFISLDESIGFSLDRHPLRVGAFDGDVAYIGVSAFRKEIEGERMWTVTLGNDDRCFQLPYELLVRTEGGVEHSPLKTSVWDVLRIMRRALKEIRVNGESEIPDLPPVSTISGYRF